MKWWAWVSAGFIVLAIVALLGGKNDMARFVRMRRM